MWCRRCWCCGLFRAVDACRRFPFLRGVVSRTLSWRWIAGQFRRAFPFAIAGGTEIALLNLPVLLVSVFVSDRVAVAQWGLTRVVAGLVRALCLQATLPLAAELGHDHAIGAREGLQQSLRARLGVRDAAGGCRGVRACCRSGRIFSRCGPMGDPVRSGADDDAVDRCRRRRALDPGAGIANYSNRGDLLARTKGLQLAVFLVLALVLTPPMGPLGAAIAFVASDLLIQFGVLAIVIMQADAAAPGAGTSLFWPCCWSW